MEDFLPVIYPKIGEKYHVAWAANPGMVWRCKAIDNSTGTVTLETPKLKRILPNVRMYDLRHLRYKKNYQKT